MQHVFNPEFLNRLDDVIVFHPLSQEHIAQIVGILLKDVQKRLGDEELTLKLTDAGVGVPREARLRREVRRAAAEAGDPEVHRGSALGEDPACRIREGRRDRGRRRRRRTKLDFRVLSEHARASDSPDHAGPAEARGAVCSRAPSSVYITPPCLRPVFLQCCLVVGRRSRRARRPRADTNPLHARHPIRCRSRQFAGSPMRPSLPTPASPGDALNYRDVQRAIKTLFATGQFEDVQIAATVAAGDRA